MPKHQHKSLILGQHLLSLSQRNPLLLAPQDRLMHTHILGRPGTGKSNLIMSLALQDMAHGNGLCFLDPHGHSAQELIKHIPSHRLQDVIFIDTSDTASPIGINLLANIPPEEHAVACSDILEAFQGIWPKGWGDRMEDILRACIFTLLAYPDTPGVSLMAIPRLLNDPRFRNHCLQYLTNAQVRAYWLEEYDTYDAKFRNEITVAVKNKMRVFLTDPLMVNIIGQACPRFSMLEAIRRQQIVIVNLARGSIGAKNAKFLGNLLAAHVRQLSFSPKTEGISFHLYLEEFQTFDSTDFSVGLAEARKFGLSYTLSHQFTSQLSEGTRLAVQETVGNIFLFGLGIKDAPVYADILPPTLPHSFQNQSIGECKVRIMEQGRPRGPLDVETFVFCEVSQCIQGKNTAQFVRKRSATRFGVRKSRVEQNHARWIMHHFGSGKSSLNRKMRRQVRKAIHSPQLAPSEKQIKLPQKPKTEKYNPRYR